MAGNLTDYTENKVLEHITGKTAFTKPTNTYLGLFTVMPSESGTGGTEVSTSTGYARQQVTWGTAVSGAIANSAQVRFPVSGNATNNYGTIVGIGLWDALTTGNLIVYGTLTSAVTINSGDSWTLSSGAVTITLD